MLLRTRRAPCLHKVRSATQHCCKMTENNLVKQLDPSMKLDLCRRWEQDMVTGLMYRSNAMFKLWAFLIGFNCNMIHQYKSNIMTVIVFVHFNHHDMWDTTENAILVIVVTRCSCMDPKHDVSRSRGPLPPNITMFIFIVFSRTSLLVLLCCPWNN